ncbi:MAG: ABC transporter permease subunit [Planctomycetota bacterium]
MPQYTPSSRSARRVKNTAFQAACIVAACVAVVVLVTLLVAILAQGAPRLSWEFISSATSSNAAETGIGPAMVGSIMILFICALSAIPLGVATAILLEEYQPKARWLRVLHGFVQNNITNLAGVPSIVYGILGFTVFVILFNAAGSPNDPWLDFGQDFYHEYPGAGGQSFFVTAEEDSPLVPAELGSDRPFYLTLEDARLGVNPADVVVAAPGDLEAIRKQVEDRLYEINSTMKAALREATVDRALQIDEATADALAGQMLTPFKDVLVADYDEMKALAAASLLDMDGLGPVQQLAPRRALRQQLIEAEFSAAGLQNTIIAGTEPLRKDLKHWYYVQVPFGKGVLAGGLTLMLVILPIIIVSSQEAIRAVSGEMRNGVLALGGTKWQAIEKVVLPSAIPGICTGTILALSRAIGEAAPILLIGYVTVQSAPDHLMGAFAALPLQIFHWTSEPDKDFRDAAAAGIIVLLIVLFSFNAIAVFIRQKTQNKH